jgi:hypothetical protein
MLADERVGGFVNGFLDSWLNLRDLGSMPPPRESRPLLLRRESARRDEDRGAALLPRSAQGKRLGAQFLDADFTFVDKRLAKLYNLPEQKTLRLADGFQRVSLKGNNQRGGLLGMAGVLTVSANGVETSPVTRGVWVSRRTSSASSRRHRRRMSCPRSSRT